MDDFERSNASEDLDVNYLVLYIRNKLRCIILTEWTHSFTIGN